MTVCRRTRCPGVRHSYQDYTLLEAELLTGRTHQIRVHLAHLGFPIAGTTSTAISPSTRGLQREGSNACSCTLRVRVLPSPGHVARDSGERAAARRTRRVLDSLPDLEAAGAGALSGMIKRFRSAGVRLGRHRGGLGWPYRRLGSKPLLGDIGLASLVDEACPAHHRSRHG